VALERIDNSVELERTDNSVEYLVDALGPTVATLAYRAPKASFGLPLGDALVVDVNDRMPIVPRGVAFLVGVTPMDQVTHELILRAASHQFAAVVLKLHGQEIDGLLRTARNASMSVVVAADEISWQRLEGLVLTILSSLRNTLAEPDTGGGDQLFSLANAVAAVIGGSVAIEDLARRVLAYSSVPGQRIDDLRRQGILDRRPPPRSWDEERYREVMAADGLVRFPARGPGCLPRAAAAIRAGNLPLGSLWAIETGQGLSAQGGSAILDGARLAALHLLTASSAPDLDRIRRSDLLRNLLNSSAPAESAWSRLGFRPGDQLALVGIAPDTQTEAGEPPLMSHISREVDRLCISLRPDAPVTASGSAVYVLLAGNQAADAAKRLAHRLVPEITRVLGGAVCASVSGQRSAPDLLPALKDEVDQVLRVNTSNASAPRVASLADVQSAAMLLHVGDSLERHPEIRQHALDELVALDRERNTELATTLLAWLETGRRIQATADRLHIHPNTLRYRIDRLRQHLEIDFDDADHRLTTWLQLRLIGITNRTATKRADQ
jgi:hypothetical protein